MSTLQVLSFRNVLQLRFYNLKYKTSIYIIFFSNLNMFAQQNHGKVNVENAVLKSCKKWEFALTFQKNGQACVFISLLIKKSFFKMWQTSQKRCKVCRNEKIQFCGVFEFQQLRNKKRFLKLNISCTYFTYVVHVLIWYLFRRHIHPLWRVL